MGMFDNVNWSDPATQAQMDYSASLMQGNQGLFPAMGTALQSAQKGAQFANQQKAQDINIANGLQALQVWRAKVNDQRRQRGLPDIGMQDILSGQYKLLPDAQTNAQQPPVASTSAPVSPPVPSGGLPSPSNASQVPVAGSTAPQGAIVPTSASAIAAAAPQVAGNVAPAAPQIAGNSLPPRIPQDLGLYDPDMALKLSMSQSRTLTPEEVKASGFPDGTVVQQDAMGGLHEINKPDWMTDKSFQQKMDIAQAEQKLGWAQLAESQRRDNLLYGAFLGPSGSAGVGGTGIGGAAPTGGPAPGTKVMTGQPYLATLSPDLAALVKSVGDGRTNPTTVLGRSGGAQRMRFMEMVHQYNPDYDQTLMPVRQAARTSFASGQDGRSVQSFNAVAGHLNLLQNAADALNNGDTRAFNSISQTWAEQTGKAPPTNFDMVKQFVSDELAKAVIGSRAAENDRAGIQESLSRASSPQQLGSAITSARELIAQQILAEKKKYEFNTKMQDFNDMLLPGAQKMLSDFPNLAGASSLPGTSGSAASALPIAAQKQLKSGIMTTFKNGQKWTLGSDGNPQRVQ